MHFPTFLLLLKISSPIAFWSEILSVMSLFLNSSSFILRMYIYIVAWQMFHMCLGKMYKLPLFMECSLCVFDIIHLKWHTLISSFFFQFGSLLKVDYWCFQYYCWYYVLLSFSQSCLIWLDALLFVILMPIVVASS